MGSTVALSDVKDMTGNIVVVTGADSGLGFECTKAFLRQGATVIMACANAERARTAIADLSDDPTIQSVETRVSFMTLDLSSLVSIKRFAHAFTSTYSHLDLLCNLMHTYHTSRKNLTSDGFGKTIGVNYLGHFALTADLLGSLENATAGRVVSLTSITHSYASADSKLDFHEKRSTWIPFKAYATSMLASLQFSNQLASQLASSNSTVTAVAAHPGFCHAALYSTSEYILPWLPSYFGQSAAKGALSVIFAATDASVHNGDTIGPDGWLQLSGMPIKVEMSKLSQDIKSQQQMWMQAERLTGVSFAFSPSSLTAVSKRTSSVRSSARHSSSSSQKQRRVSKSSSASQRSSRKSTSTRSSKSSTRSR